MANFISCTDRLPDKPGEYKIKNNSFVNNGIGYCYFDGEKWKIPEMIKHLPYKVIGWYEDEY